MLVSIFQKYSFVFTATVGQHESMIMEERLGRVFHPRRGHARFATIFIKIIILNLKKKKNLNLNT
jgi:hypothetical protein